MILIVSRISDILVYIIFFRNINKVFMHFQVIVIQYGRPWIRCTGRKIRFYWKHSIWQFRERCLLSQGMFQLYRNILVHLWNATIVNNAFIMNLLYTKLELSHWQYDGCYICYSETIYCLITVDKALLNLYDKLWRI